MTIRIAHGPNRPTTKCLISSLERGAPRVRFRTNAVRRRATHWRPHRHPTRRPGRPRAAPPNAPAAPHAPAHESSADRLRAAPAPCAACCRTAYQPPRAHTAAPGPLTLTHTGLSHSCNANTSAPTADPVANASANRLGRTHNPMPARVMKKLAVTIRLRCCQSIQMLQSPSPGPATILARNRAISAACTVGSTHRATAGASPTRPKTVTSPDATEEHRHQLRPWMIRPQPRCLRRHRLVLQP